MDDSRHLDQGVRMRMEHMWHRHAKRDAVMKQARLIGALHVDTHRVAQLLDHAEWADEQLISRNTQIARLKREIVQLGEHRCKTRRGFLS